MVLTVSGSLQCPWLGVSLWFSVWFIAVPLAGCACVVLTISGSLQCPWLGVPVWFSQSLVHCSAPGWVCRCGSYSLWCSLVQVMDSSMPLIGEHVEEDRLLIADLVITKMTQLVTATHSPQPPLASSQIQPQPMKAQTQPQPGPGAQPKPASQGGPCPATGPQGSQLQNPQQQSASQPQKSPGPPQQARSASTSPNQAFKPGTFPPQQPRNATQGQPGPGTAQRQTPQLNKSQSLTNSFSVSETPQRGNGIEDEAKAETIRSLRQSFASLFSD
ncbi:synapsin-3-like isoform X2 [Acipenser ruthenus]|uniref:synapsin-3-like isoform X2 n=1 Tax=Acipenser ruthenus TaxID=7906 RepID=UPI00274056A7|nr:synapsin-3-like isoform X2 [Acipenser ruthenus]